MNNICYKAPASGSSGTPRTDAAVRECAQPPEAEVDFVFADIARQLEKELGVANSVITKLLEACDEAEDALKWYDNGEGKAVATRALSILRSAKPQ